jgi:DNA adenine methylase
MIPLDHTCYCEPFCGAAWVLFAKEPSKVEVINDLDGELVTFWRVIQNHLEEFLRYFKWAVVSRRLFELEQKKDPVTLTDIQRAVRYFYLQRNAFGGKTYGRTFGTGATSGPRLNLGNMEETLLDIHWRLERVTVEHLDARKCIQVYDRPGTFFYIDPPYWHTPGYSVPFGDQDYVDLRKTLDGLQGRFLLSLNDVPDVRSIFKGFAFRRVTTTYSAANARVGLNGRGALRSELLIHNMPDRFRSKIRAQTNGKLASNPGFRCKPRVTPRTTRKPPSFGLLRDSSA